MNALKSTMCEQQMRVSQEVQYLALMLRDPKSTADERAMARNAVARRWLNDADEGRGVTL